MKKPIITGILLLFITIYISADDSLDLDLLDIVQSISSEGIDDEKITKLQSLLNSGANPNVISTLPYGYISGNYNGMGFILYYRYEVTPLMIARPIEVIDLLLKNGADINFQDNRGRTALMAHSYFHAWGNLDENILPFLIERGADVNIRDNFGRTALFYTLVNIGRVGALQILIESGASVNVVDNNRITILQTARILSKYRPEKIRLLEEAGAESNIYISDELAEGIIWDYMSHGGEDIGFGYGDR